MKIALAAVLGLALAAGPLQAADMNGMDMKHTSGMDHQATPSDSAATHKGSGVVRKLDSKEGTVTLAHGPVKTLGWPAMTMTFKVADKALLAKAAPEKKVDFEFAHRGKEYVITSLN